MTELLDKRQKCPIGGHKMQHIHLSCTYYINASLSLAFAPLPERAVAQQVRLN